MSTINKKSEEHHTLTPTRRADRSSAAWTTRADTVRRKRRHACAIREGEGREEREMQLARRRPRPRLGCALARSPCGGRRPAAYRSCGRGRSTLPVPFALRRDVSDARYKRPIKKYLTYE
ncbi:hypothetical protein EVAR_7478_1 [Eumeta japonica]|uniref:Uncharacterized protein n=1 Tax=Eumeta variegata TaxID=151549 RepID=A0A4C1Y5U5_EUMVA|nr:hypothetical protein EVAR_7478_1 [Eumeta japonica]